jgi:hypothetical protein
MLTPKIRSSRLPASAKKKSSVTIVATTVVQSLPLSASPSSSSKYR